MRKGWMVGDVMQGVQEDASGIPALSINSRTRSEKDANTKPLVKPL